MGSNFITPNEAIGILKNQGLVALPTETVYGLAGDVNSASAIEQIFKIKERPFFDPLIVHFSSYDQIEKYAHQTELSVVRNLADNFWPGPLTILLKKKESINPLITSGFDTVGVRIPNHSLTLEIIRELGNPLAMPSANKFSKTSPTTAQHVHESFKDINLPIVDGGSCNIGIESTVVRLNQSAHSIFIEILRPGAISKELIEERIPDIEKVVFLSASESPGNVKHHYMPNAPLVLVSHDKTALSPTDIEKASTLLNKKISSLYHLSLSPDPVIAARELYSKLRDAGDQNPDLIWLNTPVETDGMWAAIWDRIKKAATLEV